MELGTPGERLLHFIQQRFKGNKSAFAAAAGITATSLISEYCTNDKDPTGKKMDGMAQAGLNLIWYRLGIGEMDFNPESETEQTKQERARLIEQAKRDHARLGETLGRLETLT